jgi:hypothetical protein
VRPPTIVSPNELLRSRGTSSSTAPISVDSRFDVVPFLLFPEPRPTGVKSADVVSMGDA